MKLKQFALLSFLTLTFLFTSCSKDEAMEDNTPMIEKIVGDWDATEVSNGQTSNFTVTISQTDGNIKIDDHRSPAPAYTIQNFTFPFDEEAETFELGTVKGVVESDNKITVDYLFGAGASLFDVELELTR